MPIRTHPAQIRVTPPSDCKAGWPAPTCQKWGRAGQAELGRRAQHSNPLLLRANRPKKIKNI